VTLKKNEHVRVDILYSAVPPRVRLWIDLVGIVLFMLPVLVLLVWLSVPFFLDSWRIGEYSANPGGLPFWTVKFALPAGFFLLFLQALSELVKRIAAVRGTITLDTAYEKPLQ
jgi:TRAP-type mannitol/chloroaromatic compound transport system permease small subunit